MNIQNLIRFVSKARKKCGYEVVGGGRETTLKDGTKIIGPYTDGKMKYIDSYKGFEEFRGMEEVIQKARRLWKRKYEGCIIEVYKGMAEEVYEILKHALRQFPKTKPFRRGPKHLRIGEYQYFDVCRGDMKLFSGKEKILYKGQEVYSLNYKGGVSK